ncbi:MAG: hypothetical protein BZY88_17500 [SAR202 cluster bacterium Io17-Chloro-G9]|nr:MAG: hypothetical protein BZY88_17500 [SAR202 cluster bacterium Io17-Chloro-G9]
MGHLRWLVFLFLLGPSGLACAISEPTASPGPTVDIESTVAAAVQAAVPTSVLEPTPNLDATVEARVQAAIGAILTPEAIADEYLLATPAAVPTPASTPVPAEIPAQVSVDPYRLIQLSVVKIVAEIRGGTSQGSGVIVGNGRYVITNAHVVEGSVGSLEVSINTETGLVMETDGNVVFTSGNVDLALIKIDTAIGEPLEFSRTLPSLGDDLILGGFPGIGGDTLTVTNGKVAGFQFDGTAIKFDGQLGSGSSGGAAINQQGEVVGIATLSSGEVRGGSLGILLSSPVVSSTLALGMLEDFRAEAPAPAVNAEYDLSILGIPAAARVPDGWDAWATFGYFDMRAPGTSTANPTDSYRVAGIFVAQPEPGESSTDFLNRLIAESAGEYQIVPDSQINPPNGFTDCVLVFNQDRYQISNFEARGTVIGTTWISVAGLYTRFCVRQTAERTVIGFVESPTREASSGDRSLLSPPAFELGR